MCVCSKLIVVPSKPLLYEGGIFSFHVNSKTCKSPFILKVEIKSIFYEGNKLLSIDTQNKFKLGE